MRAIWSGSINFGLINIPASYFPLFRRAASTSKLLKIIEDKSKGKKKITSQPKKVSKLSDELMSMLKASLESRKQKAS